MDILARELMSANWFSYRGTGIKAHAILDGQFGSSGKGMIAALFAETLAKEGVKYGLGIDTVVSNAGPNSGHSAWVDGEFITTRQIPMSAVVLSKFSKGLPVHCYLDAGAAIDKQCFNDEVSLIDKVSLWIDGYASVVDDYCREDESVNLHRISSTMQGTGASLIRKMKRVKESILSNCGMFAPSRVPIMTPSESRKVWRNIGAKTLYSNVNNVLLETCQGYGLGINDGIYPYTTSRDCNVTKALLDARLHPVHLHKTLGCLRLFPIRTGSVEGATSGPGWNDCEMDYVPQCEAEWSDLNMKPEISTVTKRKRRLFGWSWTQYVNFLIANRPDALFFNFCNYVPEDLTHCEKNNVVWHLLSPVKPKGNITTRDGLLSNFIECAINMYKTRLEKLPDFILLGYGPRPNDVRILRDWHGGAIVADRIGG